MSKIQKEFGFLQIASWHVVLKLVDLYFLFRQSLHVKERHAAGGSLLASLRFSQRCFAADATFTSC